jgi:protein gp37
MAEGTKIEWADHTFNPWIGCTKVGPGCDHCYAEADFDKRRHVVTWGAGQPRKLTADSTWALPLRWNKEAERLGVRYRVFCASLADVFDNEVPTEWRGKLWALINATPHLDWLLLTKRIGNVKTMMYDAEEPQPNVWIGATITSQEEADRDIPKLLAVPAAKRFLSMEPLLGPVDIRRYMWPVHASWPAKYNTPADALAAGAEVKYKRQALVSKEWADHMLSWVIVGGESGPGARPMHPDWARSLRDQCKAAGVPFLFKQWGNWRAAHWFDGPDADEDLGDDFVDLDRTDHLFLANDGRTWDTLGGRLMYPPLPLGHWCLMVDEGKKAAGRLLDGRTWDEVPS